MFSFSTCRAPCLSTALPSPNPGISVLSGAQIFGGQITLTAHKQSQTQLLPHCSAQSAKQVSRHHDPRNATIDGSTGVAVQANAEDANALTGKRLQPREQTWRSAMPGTLLAPPAILAAVSVQKNAVPTRS